MTARQRLVLLAAGGTGGHMFPAEATARELMARGHRVALVTDRRGAGLADRFAGAEVLTIAAGGVAGRDLLQRGLAVLRLGTGLLQARRLIARLKPDAALGFGGYASLPTMGAALLAGVPTALHEQNAVLGRANRLLAPRMRLIATSFEGTRAIREADQAKVVVTGNPVRPDIAALAGAPYQPPGEREPFRLLVTGGSQGARVFGRVVPGAIARLPVDLRARLKIDQQARPEDLETVTAAYRDAGVAAEVAAFFKDMPARLAVCHLLICRAGASTCAELTASGRPAILVPYPHAIDDHQMANAQAIDTAGGAWLIPERCFDEAKLARRLEALVAMPETLASAARAAHAVGRVDAAGRLAAVVERLLPANGNHESLRVAAE
jgi:UDP-N-acetylglucosamine--N-acetylmuramyl-(pentapeptide) pyrophosphoryl-undecaprenol N-acetylglucosamine transferase